MQKNTPKTSHNAITVHVIDMKKTLHVHKRMQFYVQTVIKLGTNVCTLKHR